MQRSTLPDSQGEHLLNSSHTRGNLSFRELPLVAATIAACALVVGMSPTLSSLLDFDRTAIAGGQAFRLITAQLAHWSFDHLLLQHIGFTSSFTAAERDMITVRVGALISSPGFTGKKPGGLSRWSTCRSSEWQPLQRKLVEEVSYDHLTGDRFRHGTKLLAKPLAEQHRSYNFAIHNLLVSTESGLYCPRRACPATAARLIFGSRRMSRRALPTHISHLRNPAVCGPVLIVHGRSRLT